MYIETPGNGTVNKGIKDQILKKYGYTEDANANEMYVINQNLIWLAVNNEENAFSSNEIKKHANLKNIYASGY